MDRTNHLIFLGKGRYTRAFRLRGSGKVRLYTYAPNNIVKDLLVAISGAPHLPEIEFIKTHPDYRGHIQYVYEMPYYETIRAAHKEAWATLKALNETRTRVINRMWEYWTVNMGHPVHFITEFAAQCNLHIVNDLLVPVNGFKVSEQVRNSLGILATEAYRASSAILFEFRKCNTGVTEDGSIVLRDPLFDATGTWLDTNSEEAAQYFKDEVEKLDARSNKGLKLVGGTS